MIAITIETLTDADVPDLLAFARVVGRGDGANADVERCDARGWLHIDRTQRRRRDGGLCWGRRSDQGPVALVDEVERLAALLSEADLVDMRHAVNGCRNHFVAEADSTDDLLWTRLMGCGLAERERGVDGDHVYRVTPLGKLAIGLRELDGEPERFDDEDIRADDLADVLEKARAWDALVEMRGSLRHHVERDVWTADVPIGRRPDFITHSIDTLMVEDPIRAVLALHERWVALGRPRVEPTTDEQRRVRDERLDDWKVEQGEKVRAQRAAKGGGR